MKTDSRAVLAQKHGVISIVLGDILILHKAERLCDCHAG